ncbi:MAG: DinB family protein [Anaerolineae bacterium]|nr:DinB family protein [Anaerolineae bacterium]
MQRANRSAPLTHDQALRTQLVALLRGGQAYMPFDQAVADFPAEHINTKPPNTPYSFWHLLEHIRLAQWAILDYIRNSAYTAPAWPADYWPAQDATTDVAGWERTLDQFRADLNALVALVEDPATDLAAPLPHAPQHNILREILVVADHNAYHTGELAILRQTLGLWPEGHR